eukprot:PhM_4_TR511/c0_g1_i1/m.98228
MSMFSVDTDKELWWVPRNVRSSALLEDVLRDGRHHDAMIEQRRKELDEAASTARCVFVANEAAQRRAVSLTESVAWQQMFKDFFHGRSDITLHATNLQRERDHVAYLRKLKQPRPQSEIDEEAARERVRVADERETERREHRRRQAERVVPHLRRVRDVVASTEHIIAHHREATRSRWAVVGRLVREEDDERARIVAAYDAMFVDESHQRRAIGLYDVELEEAAARLDVIAVYMLSIMLHEHGVGSLLIATVETVEWTQIRQRARVSYCTAAAADAARFESGCLAQLREEEELRRRDERRGMAPGGQRPLLSTTEGARRTGGAGWLRRGTTRGLRLVSLEGAKLY